MKYLQTINELDVENDQEFKYKYNSYKRDTKLRDMLNKMFSAKLKHVFSSDRLVKIKDGVDFGGASFICVNEKGKFVFITSSEWASIDLM